MKKIVLPIAVLAMLALIAAAFSWDCVRYAGNARHRVALADDEMQKHETRLLKLLADNPQLTPEVQSAVAAYKGAGSPQKRQGLYDAVVRNFRDTMASKSDPTNTLDRKFMDDIAGAINRHDVAQKQYDIESAAYQQFLTGFRGSVAKMFSSAARADAPPSG